METIGTIGKGLTEEQILASNEREKEKALMEAKKEKELKELDERRAAIVERISKLIPLREDIVFFNRYNHDLITFLEIAGNTLEDRRRTNWYGEVIRVSDVDSSDTLLESKKQKLKPGQAIIYNPESAYSLNIADFPEIWILHVDSIICFDTDFNYYDAKKVLIEKKFTHQANMSRINFQRARAVEEQRKLSGQKNQTERPNKNIKY